LSQASDPASSSFWSHLDDGRIVARDALGNEGVCSLVRHRFVEDALVVKVDEPICILRESRRKPTGP